MQEVFTANAKNMELMQRSLVTLQQQARVAEDRAQSAERRAADAEQSVQSAIQQSKEILHPLPTTDKDGTTAAEGGVPNARQQDADAIGIPADQEMTEVTREHPKAKHNKSLLGSSSPTEEGPVPPAEGHTPSTRRQNAHETMIPPAEEMEDATAGARGGSLVPEGSEQQYDDKNGDRKLTHPNVKKRRHDAGARMISPDQEMGDAATEARGDSLVSEGSGRQYGDRNKNRKRTQREDPKIKMQGHSKGEEDEDESDDCKV